MFVVYMFCEVNVLTSKAKGLLAYLPASIISYHYRQEYYLSLRGRAILQLNFISHLGVKSMWLILLWLRRCRMC